MPRSSLEEIRTLYLDSLFKSWENRTGIVQPTPVEHTLLVQHGWTYEEFVKENELELAQRMKELGLSDQQVIDIIGE
jgi:hypothetical protein